jgi:hypothetical protein
MPLILAIKDATFPDLVTAGFNYSMLRERKTLKSVALKEGFVFEVDGYVK